MGRRGILIYAAAAMLSAVACVWLNDAAVAWDAFLSSLTLLAQLGPLVIGGLLIAGFAQVLAPKDRISALLGEQSGLRGLLLATIAGALTPGGPFASFPLVYALYRSGADFGAVVAYITAWSVIGVHRLLIWEIPLLGVDLSMLRYGVSLPLSIIAGLTARRLAARGWHLPPGDRKAEPHGGRPEA